VWVWIRGDEELTSPWHHLFWRTVVGWAHTTVHRPALREHDGYRQTGAVRMIVMIDVLPLFIAGSAKCFLMVRFIVLLVINSSLCVWSNSGIQFDRNARNKYWPNIKRLINRRHTSFEPQTSKRF